MGAIRQPNALPATIVATANKKDTHYWYFKMANYVEPSGSIPDLMLAMGQRARAASRQIAIATSEAKTSALQIAARELRTQLKAILVANEKDIARGKQNNMSSALLDRLLLDESRIIGITESLLAIADLPDPVGKVIAQWTRPNGLRIERVATPLGVVGVIFESRPNVTADAGALCLKAGNAVILRGGSDSFFSSQAIHKCLLAGLASASLPESAIQLVPTTDRLAVGELLSGLGGNVDVVVPRGGKSLVARVQSESRVPVFAHLEGVCHVFVDEEADEAMAQAIVLNSKMRRTGICGAAETLLVHENWAKSKLVPLVDALEAEGCQIRGDERVCQLVKDCVPATENDWSTEYLDAILSIKIVANVEEAIEHINRFGSHHTESIVTENVENAGKFLNEIDSAILLHNASTQFADGGEFGMGAEIGIATGKMHARGPVGVEQLTSFNYRVHGSGQIRPR
jgi:glutamate-5-semialdehyde dehydrogenase